MKRHFYNENDPRAAAWLRELIARGLIPDGVVDTRSILDIKPEDLHGFIQVHLFAGIGGWPLALRLAGWPEEKPCWTGSAPCQPLSCGGLRKGHADERHLWPAFYNLVAECGPTTLFGEQVGSTDGLEWFSGVRADLEGAGYACGGSVMPAGGIGAPHRRYRLWWVAIKRDGAVGVAHGRRRQQRDAGERAVPESHAAGAASGGGSLTMADDQRARLEGQRGDEREGNQPRRKRAHKARSTAAGGEPRAGNVEHSPLPEGERLGSLEVDVSGQTGPGPRAVAHSGHDAGCAQQEQQLQDNAAGIGQPGAERAGGLANADGGQSGERGVQRSGEHRQQQEDGGTGRMADTDGGTGTQHERESGERSRGISSQVDAAERGSTGVVDNAQCDGRGARGNDDRQDERILADAAGDVSSVGDTEERGCGLVGIEEHREQQSAPGSEPLGSGDHRRIFRPWDAFDVVACRDGKARRVEPKYVSLADGISGILVPCGDSRSQGNHETEEEVNADQKINVDGGNEVRDLREVEVQASCPPQGRESPEQFPEQLADFVRLLPSSIALAELHGHSLSKEALQIMQQTLLQAGIVQYSPEQVQKAWSSLEGAQRKSIWDTFGALRLVRTIEFPLVKTSISRMTRLRGYGNAICPQLAAQFILAAEEARADILTSAPIAQS